MLNIKIYKGVPFQSNYNNVCLFANINAVETFLERYKIGAISSVAMFYANENKITLTQYYEDANYMLIEDTNAVRTKKFYFIDNMIFKSASAVEYSINCDVWTTYNFDIIFEESLCVRAHCDALNIPEYKVNSNNLKSNKILEFTNAECITNYLIQPFDNDDISGSLLAIINESDASNMLIRKVDSAFDFWASVQCLSVNQYDQSGTTHNYEIIKLYFIPYFDIVNSYLKWQAENVASVGVDVSITGVYSRTFKLHNGTYTKLDETGDLFSPFMQGEILSRRIYKEGLSREKFEGKRVIIGTLNNYREIDATGFTNQDDIMSLNLYMIQTKQIEIMLEVNNIKINLTSSFEIPFMNDEYILYLNQNQNQINVSNAQNAINMTLSLVGVGAGVVLSPLTAGASLAMGAIGATGALAKGITSFAMKNAQLEDMKNKFDRLDGINNNCLLMLKYGVGAFTIDDNDRFTILQYRHFGNETQYYITSYIPSNTALYNYYFVKFENAVLHGNFNDNIRTILTNIFNNGVRIWCDYSEYLNDVGYLKE